ncbi:CHAT domain-containing protein [Streptomyces sp. NPDC058614]|uniref:CHAT domain-containing protein n=1 Tax=Streptomyces sp. NPDC058614 TaxID=3346557 RepID=UPI003654CCBE
MDRAWVKTLDDACARHARGDVVSVWSETVDDALLRLESLLTRPSRDAPSDGSSEAARLVARVRWYRSQAMSGNGAEDEADRAVRALDALVPGAVTSALEADLLEAFTVYLADALTASLNVQWARPALWRERTRCLRGLLEDERLPVELRGEAAVVLGWAFWAEYEGTPAHNGGPVLALSLQAFEVAYDCERVFPAPDLVAEHLLIMRAREADDFHHELRWGASVDPDGQHLRMLSSSVAHARYRLSAVGTDRDAIAAATAELGMALADRFVFRGHRADLDEALEVTLAAYRRPGRVPSGTRSALARAAARALQLRTVLDRSEQDTLDGARMLAETVQAVDARDPAAKDLLDSLVQIAVGMPDNGSCAALELAQAAVDRADAAGGEPPVDLLWWQAQLSAERFRKERTPEHFTTAVGTGHRALRRLSLTDADYPVRRIHLAMLHYDGWRTFQRLPDLDQAIETMRRAVAGDWDVPTARERELLWEMLYRRAELVGDVTDWRDAALAFGDLTKRYGLPDATSVTNAAAIVLTARIPLPKEGLDHVVGLLELALWMEGEGQLVPRWGRLLNLSGVLVQRYRLTGEAADIDRAVTLAEASVYEAGRVGHNPAELLGSLAHALLTRGQADDLARADVAARRAIRASPLPARRAVFALWRGAGLMGQRRQRVGDDDSHGRAEILRMCRDVAHTVEAGVDTRRDGARVWGAEATAMGDYAAACEAWWLLMQLITDRRWHAAAQQERREGLKRHMWVPRVGAACAIRAGRLPLAVRFVEEGRTVMRTTSRQRVACIAAVTADQPDLAERMEVVHQGLAGFDQMAFAERLSDYRTGQYALLSFEGTGWWVDLLEDEHWGLGSDPKKVAERMVEHQFDERVRHPQALRRTMVTQWQSLVDEMGETARSRLRPAEPIDRLRAHLAAGQAAVVLNVSSAGCDALIVTPDGLRSLSLPELTEADTARYTRDLYQCLFRLDFGERSPELLSKLRHVTQDMRQWLWDSVTAPVLDTLGHHRPPTDDAPWPRVWWCPTGSLATLPVHAAADLRHEATGACVLDRVVSSYTTTLSALADTLSADPATASTKRMLLLGMSSTTGHADIPGLAHDLKRLHERLPLDSEVLLDDQASVDTVLQACATREWLHIAAHGLPDAGTASARLFLSDGSVSVDRLSWQMHAASELVYLAACHSASSIGTLPDEAEHLAAQFQANGCRHVIASLWAASHKIAGFAADSFYTALTETYAGDTDRAAEALHHTVRRLRKKYPQHCYQWAGFVHFGR